MLERGRDIEHINDYTKPTRKRGIIRTGASDSGDDRNYPVLRRDYPLNE